MHEGFLLLGLAFCCLVDIGLDWSGLDFALGLRRGFNAVCSMNILYGIGIGDQMGFFYSDAKIGFEVTSNQVCGMYVSRFENLNRR